jgi:hypothetical protein
MSTIKSSSEDLTLNADGLGKDIKFQSNGVEKASLTDAGVFTATSFAGSGASLTNLPASGFTSAVRVWGGGGVQLITKSTYTKIQFDTEVYDLGGEFDSSTNYRFTATDTGKYHVSLFVAPSTYTAQTQWTVRIYKNGSYNFAGIRSDMLWQGSTVGIDIDVELSANQYIEGFVWHNDSVDRNINLNNYDTVMSIHRIA